MFDLTFNVEDKGALTPLTLAIDQAVIAGWTGRDPVARDKHIAELEAIGIARPASTPIYYRVAARRITFADRIEVSGGDSSGEVEFVLIGWQGRIFVGCGSDHTDRKVEAYGVTVSKQMCEKPVASTFWAFDEVAPHWDSLLLRSSVVENGKRVTYLVVCAEGGNGCFASCFAKNAAIFPNGNQLCAKSNAVQSGQVAVLTSYRNALHALCSESSNNA